MTSLFPWVYFTKISTSQDGYLRIATIMFSEIHLLMLK